VNEQTLATALGWFSIGLGLTEVGAARRVGKFLGMEDQTELLRVFGLREIATGIGILSYAQPEKRAPWLSARIGGDVLDLLALGSALQTSGEKRTRVAGAIAAVAGVTTLDLLCRRHLSNPRRGTENAAATKKTEKRPSASAH